MSFDYSMYDALVYYGDEDKRLLLDGDIIDEGIIELVDAINGCEFFVVMNACQGFLVENEKSKHCSHTHVCFFVLEHFYYVAEKLFILLTEKFGSRIGCGMYYQADYDFIDSPEGEIKKDNGQVIPIYQIEIEESPNNLHLSTYQEVVEFIRKYAENINREFELEVLEFSLGEYVDELARDIQEQNKI